MDKLSSGSLRQDHGGQVRAASSQAIRALIQAGQPLFMWGPPGVGKTARVLSWARDERAECEVLIGSTMDPTDLARPILSGDNVRLAAAPWVQRILRRAEEGVSTWVFMDEFTCSPRSIQAAFLRVVQDFVVGETPLPAGTRIIAAGNPSDSAADYHDLSHATTNRWAHVAVDLSADDWAAGELSGWGKGAGFCAPLLAHYLTGPARGELLQQPKPESDPGAWPSPRSWSNLIRALNYVQGQKPEDRILSDVGMDVTRSIVGNSAADALRTWTKHQDLPDAAEVLSGRVSIGGLRGDQTNMVMMSVISLAIHEDRHNDMFRVIAGLGRPDQVDNIARRAIQALDGSGKPWRKSLDSSFSKIINIAQSVAAKVA